MSSFASLIVTIALLTILTWLWLNRRNRTTPHPGPGRFFYRPADFEGITHGEINGLPVSIGKGSLPNALGQRLLITVTGTSDKSVIDYFNMAQFDFELKKEPVEIPEEDGDDEGDVLEKGAPPLSMSEIFKGGEGSVRVVFDVSPETMVKQRQGSVLVRVDPPVPKDKYNNYVCTTNNRVKVKIRVREGTVEAQLYKNCVAVRRKPKKVVAGGKEPFEGQGPGTFHFSVKGAGNPNKYELTGSWDYDFDQPVANVSDDPCP